MKILIFHRQPEIFVIDMQILGLLNFMTVKIMCKEQKRLKYIKCDIKFHMENNVVDLKIVLITFYGNIIKKYK